MITRLWLYLHCCCGVTRKEWKRARGGAEWPESASRSGKDNRICERRIAHDWVSCIGEWGLFEVGREGRNPSGLWMVYAGGWWKCGGSFFSLFTFLSTVKQKWICCELLLFEFFFVFYIFSKRLYGEDEGNIDGVDDFEDGESLET
jgi:hypothetical protein